jgi:hypothetical protein
VKSGGEISQLCSKIRLATFTDVLFSSPARRDLELVKTYQCGAKSSDGLVIPAKLDWAIQEGQFDVYKLIKAPGYNSLGGWAYET